MLAAFENLKSLRGTPKPIDAGYKTIWLCSYKINNNYIAEAITIVGMD